MIFDPEIYCNAAENAELDGSTPLTLAGNGLWVGVLSRGECLLDGFDRPGQSGDILLGHTTHENIVQYKGRAANDAKAFLDALNALL